MENLGFYAMYVVEGIFIFLLLYAGIFSYKFPMKYQMALDYIAPDGKYYTTMVRYPHYSSKCRNSCDNLSDYSVYCTCKYIDGSNIKKNAGGLLWQNTMNLADRFMKRRKNIIERIRREIILLRMIVQKGMRINISQ